MSFIETHLVEPEQAKPLVAVKEAFRALKNGGNYTLKMIAFCGVVLGVIFWIPERFAVSGTGLSAGQVLVEAVFAFYWHRFFLLNEAELSGGDFRPFMMRSLFYYLIFGLTFLIGIGVFIGLTGNLSDVQITALLLFCAMASLFALPRVGLVFPAIAVDNPARSMADAFVLSSGNASRLAVGYFLMLIAVLVMMMPLIAMTFFVEEHRPELVIADTYLILSNLFYGLAGAVTILLWAGLNSSFYRQLGGDIHPTTDLGADGELNDNECDSDGPSSAGYGDRKGG